MSMTSRPSSGGGHVAVAAFPYGSHAEPLLAAARGLAAASPGTAFSFFSTRDSIQKLFNSSDDDEVVIRAYEVWDGVAEGRVVAPDSSQERIELFMTAAPAELRAGVEAAEGGRMVTCVVSDAFLWFAGEMAEEMGVPWLPLWTAGPASLSSHLYTHFIRNQILAGGSRKEELSLSFVPGMSKVMVQDLPEGVVLGDLNSFFSQMLCQMGEALPRATAVFINSFEELDHTITRDLESKLTKFLNVGPFSLVLSLSSVPPHDDRGCLPWLDKHRAAEVVYVSFGSVTVPPLKELVAIAQALEGSGVPFIWSMRDNVKAGLPKGFLDATKGQGLVVPWAPQTQILSHDAVGVFVTHGGWNSVLESIAGGVPMICRPFFGDQRLNGRMIQDVWQIGVGVEGEGFSKEGFEKCLGQLLSLEEGKRMRENIKKLKELASEAVGPRGSSTNNFKLLLDIITKA